MAQQFEYDGVTYDVIEREDMSWAEADELERITGLTSAELLDGRNGGRSRVSAAHAWIAMRRAEREAAAADRPAVPCPTWEVYRDTPMKATHVLPQPETADPPPLSEYDSEDPTAGTDAPEPGSETSDVST